MHWADSDGDAYCADLDCDDAMIDVNPDATEICDGFDTNCDGELPAEEMDLNDNGMPDCAEDRDAGMPDAGMPDAGLDAGVDAGDEDASVLDAALPDAGLPDAMVPMDGSAAMDAGVAPGDDGCGCRAGGAPVGAVWVLFSVVAVRRRKHNSRKHN